MSLFKPNVKDEQKQWAKWFKRQKEEIKLQDKQAASLVLVGDEDEDKEMKERLYLITVECKNTADKNIEVLEEYESGLTPDKQHVEEQIDELSKFKSTWRLPILNTKICRKKDIN